MFFAAFFSNPAVAANSNGIKSLLANGLSTFFMKGKPNFSNGPKSLHKNLCDYRILCNWVSDNLILADELAKDLQRLKTCVLVNKNLCGSLLSSLESPATWLKF